MSYEASENWSASLYRTQGAGVDRSPSERSWGSSPARSSSRRRSPPAARTTRLVPGRGAPSGTPPSATGAHVAAAHSTARWVEAGDSRGEGDCTTTLPRHVLKSVRGRQTRDGAKRGTHAARRGRRRGRWHGGSGGVIGEGPAHHLPSGLVKTANLWPRDAAPSHLAFLIGSSPGVRSGRVV